ncbi:hypothetical protein AB4305_34125 [Nocardia sp. 2YAB30]|uniref:hypothetical protein n=1 Tax=Nocardia sp. 2YAB30 TaxID=3233022 RepID=UPI003F95654C
MDSGDPNHKHTAICLVRADVSGLESPRHATEAQRHALRLGYVHLYTVRPPADHSDPIGYALGIAAGLGVAALVVYDLATVDNMPSRVCDVCDLETVIPPQTWAASSPDIVDPAHQHPDHPLTVAEAKRTMQQHIACRAVECPRKSSAYSCLVKAGKIVPPVDTPRERAAARGVLFPPLNADLMASGLPDTRTLRDVLDGLAKPDADPPAVAARLASGHHG